MVAFESYARNLVPDDTNRMTDIFVKNRDTRALERVMAGITRRRGRSPTAPACGLRSAETAASWSSNRRPRTCTSRDYTRPPGGIYRVYRAALTESAGVKTNLLASIEANGVRGRGARKHQPRRRCSVVRGRQPGLPDYTAPAGVGWVCSALRHARLAHSIRARPGQRDRDAQASLAPASTDQDVVVWSSSANNLSEIDPKGRLNVFARAIHRSVQTVTPTTIDAVMIAPWAWYTNVDVMGQTSERTTPRTWRSGLTDSFTPPAAAQPPPRRR